MKVILIFYTFSIFLFNFSHSSAAPNDVRLAILGDSLTVGVLSDTHMGQASEFHSELAKILKGLLKSGDFTEKNFRSLTARPENAFATTSEPWGIRQAIANHLELSVEEIRFSSAAVSGARYHNAANQMQSLGSDFDYVFMMYSGNDVAAMVSYESFRRQVTGALNTLSTLNPNAKILIASMPHVDQVKNFSPRFALKQPERSVKSTFPAINIKIPAFEIAYDLQPVRLKMARGVFEIDEEGNDAEARVNIYNSIISDVVTDYANPNIILLESAPSFIIAEEHLSVDGFHPSKAGQQGLGQLLHDELAAVLSSKY